VVAVALPREVCDALGIPAAQRLPREGWRGWLQEYSRARTVLLWISPRGTDDQELFRCIGSHLAADARLYTFHAMSVLTTDRLTGDAVQQLLNDAGLADTGCVNSGFGYYARRFVRAPGTVPVEIPAPPPPVAAPAARARKPRAPKA
jgi:hypothetical protein